jgi:hypothetical protein
MGPHMREGVAALSITIDLGGPSEDEEGLIF